MYKAIAAAVVFLSVSVTGHAIEVQPAPQATNTAAFTDVTPVTQSRGDIQTYVIQLKQDPGIAYQGGMAGYASTAPVAGEGYDASAPHVQAYTANLVSVQDSILSGMGALDRKIYNYCHTMNGFAARLTADEVSALQANDQVASVIQDYSVDINTNDTPTFLGLNDRRDGLRKRQQLRGDDIIVGILDTGAVQEHPSFSDTLDVRLPGYCENNADSIFRKEICKALTKLGEKVVYSEPPERWSGTCEAGEGWSEEDCNNKMIGARWYVDGFIAGRGSVVEGEFLSPRDSSGHGSHTAGTAVGNEVNATLNGTRVARISGMAPRARLAVYKVCWLAPGATNFSCFFSDSAAATDQAVADGVDVLNFSVGTAPSFVDEQDVAFLRASNAGVFVARSGGNDGPGFGTLNAGEPWVTTVAASTAEGTLFVQATKVNRPASVKGTYGSLEGLITRPLSEGEVRANLGAAEPIDACGAGLTNDLSGKIALIARGTCGFVEKVENAASAGAIGVLMYSDDRPKTRMGGDATELSLTIPGVMVDNEVGLSLQAALADDAVNATLNDTNFIGEDREGNIMAGFSSRGPFFTVPDWIKPDITAPGVNVLAAYAPDQADGSQGDLFDYLSGTSMSGPHIAGIGALLKEARPDWSPAQIKSAMMTTARQDVVKEDGETPADPFDFGAGHVVPNASISPGLTYDAGLLDYAAASCGTDSPIPGATPDVCDFLVNGAGFSSDTADLNLPSIGIDSIPGEQTVTRTVTAVADYKRRGRPSNRIQKYTAEVEAPEGFDVTVTPSEIALRPGESASYEVTVSNASAAPNSWEFGALTWARKNGKGADVRSPIAVNAVAFITEDEVDGEGSEGSAQFDLTFGYTGEYTAQVHGLNGSGVFLPPALADDADDNFAFGFGDPSQFALIIDDTAPGTAFRRFAVFNEYTSGNDDLDLYLYYCPGLSCTQIASSAQAGSDESVDMLLPIPYDPVAQNPYLLFIHAFDTEAADSTLIYFDQQFGVVDDAGNLTVTGPATAETGVTAPVTVDWADLPTGPFAKQLGAISHSDANGIQNLTIIDIENDQGVSICDFGLCPE
ncbi:MAG: S8 family serine peptidase [Woeseiaceae bacterium]